VGVLVAAYGTYLVIEWYVPVSGRGFWRSCGGFLCDAITLHIARIKNSVATWAEISEMLAKEDRRKTIAGILIIFAGFLIQAAGAFLWLLDIILPQVSCSG
jgi:hypothetical protein